MAEPQTNPVQFQIDPQGIALLQINRPQARNALNWAAQDQFSDCVKAVKQNNAIRVLIITGTGDKTFVSGGDLKQQIRDHGPAHGQRLNRVMSGALDELRKLPVPVIAAINGDAFGGGCEIITACDLRIACRQTRFSFAQVRMGLTTGWGGGARLVQQIGLSRAGELLLSGRIFDAQEAHQIGLLHRLIDQEDGVLDAAHAWAAEFIDLPAGSLAAIKKLLYASAALPPAEVGQLETALFSECWSSPDHLEALAAFSDKRSPLFNKSQ